MTKRHPDHQKTYAVIGGIPEKVEGVGLQRC